MDDDARLTLWGNSRDSLESTGSRPEEGEGRSGIRICSVGKNGCLLRQRKPTTSLASRVNPINSLTVSLNRQEAGDSPTGATKDAAFSKTPPSTPSMKLGLGGVSKARPRWSLDTSDTGTSFAKHLALNPTVHGEDSCDEDDSLKLFHLHLPAFNVCLSRMCRKEGLRLRESAYEPLETGDLKIFRLI
ncbi:unnamed protein product [Protopolystoma xenopodis]|uniref:Uncharacterized protein n=1 Tax=Protopolystoma xenopodis TaxID=117903 RepID=A0A448X3Y8_9PLAT|nr:unnamed protein product [Protopolystoma xenopodis]